MPRTSRILKNGEKFNKLTVIGLSHKVGDTEFYTCRCDCGNITVVRKSHLVNNLTKSCGCLPKGKPSTHNATGTRLYSIWQHIKDKCTNKNSSRYQALPIEKEWINSFENFRDWATETNYNDTLFLSRRNVLEGYNKENCYWAKDRTHINRSALYDFNGEKNTLIYFAKKYNICYDTLKQRLKSGMTLENAINYSLGKVILNEGDKFGNLTVIGVAPTSSRTRKNSYLCECTCGELCTRTLKELLEGINLSCNKCLEE